MLASTIKLEKNSQEWLFHYERQERSHPSFRFGMTPIGRLAFPGDWLCYSGMVSMGCMEETGWSSFQPWSAS